MATIKYLKSKPYYISPLKYFKNWNSIASIVSGGMLSCADDLIPPYSTYADLSPKPTYGCCPDNLRQVFIDIMAFVNDSHEYNDFQRHFEYKFFKKCATPFGSARNCRMATNALAYMNSRIQWDWAGVPTAILQDTDVLEALKAAGIRPIYQWDQSNLHKYERFVDPPKAQASAGMFSYDGQLYVGNKSNVWTRATEVAYQIFDDPEVRALNWDSIMFDGAECNLANYFRHLLHKWELILMPAWRLDGGPNKLRMLLIGNAAVYILEQWFWDAIKPSMLSSTHMGYRPEKVQEFFEIPVPKNYKYISKDYKAFDEHQQPQIIAAVYKAICKLCNIPEWLGVFIWAYSCYCPALVLDGKTLEMVVRLRNGQAASGIGGFSNCNTILAMTIDYATHKYLNAFHNSDLPWLPGIYMGDDQVAVSPWGVEELLECVWTFFGMECDREDTIADRDDAVFLRRFFRRGEGYKKPVLFSRLRNMVFPELASPNDVPDVKRIMSYRAQTIELMNGPIVTHQFICDKILTFFVPERISNDDTPDERLSEMAQRLGLSTEEDAVKMNVAHTWNNIYDKRNMRGQYNAN